MATRSKKVLIEASVIFAFVDRAHPKHQEASAFFRYFAINEYTLFLDTLNLNATYEKISASISPSFAKDVLRVIFLSDINIIYPDEADTKAAHKTMSASHSADLTFTQAVAAVIADRRSIPQICTFDFLHQLFGLSLFYLPL